MIGSKGRTTPWVRSLKRACGAVCAVAGVMLVSASCGSSTVPPQAYVSATIGSGNTGVCAFSGGATWVTVGTSDNPGGSAKTGNDGVTVVCTVSPSGSSFDVQASATATVPGNCAGSQCETVFTIEGTLANDATTVQTGITATFASNVGSDQGTYTQTGGCTVSFVPDVNEHAAITSSPTGTIMGVYSGRVWGNLTCPAMVNSISGQMSTCLGIAEFKFEDCAE